MIAVPVGAKPKFVSKKQDNERSRGNYFKKKTTPRRGGGRGFLVEKKGN